MIRPDDKPLSNYRMQQLEESLQFYGPTCELRHTGNFITVGELISLLSECRRLQVAVDKYQGEVAAQ